MSRLSVLALLLALVAPACTHVRFNEKEALSDRMMQFDYDAAGAELMGHVITPREGAVGGFTASVGTGGCGCN